MVGFPYRAAAVSVVAAALVLAGGCAPQLDRIEVSLQENTDQVALLRAEQQRIRQELEAISALLRLDQDVGLESDAQRLAKIGQLSTRIEQLIQTLEDNAQYMRNLSARVDLLATRAGVATLGEFKGPAPGDEEGTGDDLPEEGRAIFRAAQLDRNRGNLELAREGLREFLQKYDRSELADDALYELGDLAYGEKEYSQALSHFQDLFDRFPASEKVPAGMYKSARCMQSIGREVEGRELLQRLIDQYPESAEAALARQDLQQE